MLRTHWMLGGLLVLALTVAGPSAMAGKPGGGGGGTTPDPRLAYLLPTRTGHDLVVSNADGSNRVTLVRGLSGYERPDWTHDGRVIFNDANKRLDSTYGIWIVNSDGTGLRKLRTTNAPHTSPRWSPVPTAEGRHRIAFCDIPAGGAAYDLYLADADGGDMVRLTATTDVTENHPTWSPDAGRIASRVSWSGQQRVEVHALAADGRSIATSTALTGVGASPILTTHQVAHLAWSRTTGAIALNTIPSGESNYNTWVVDAAAPGFARRVTNSASVPDIFPTWSPDDGTILLTLNGSGRNTGLATVDPAGGTPVSTGIAGWCAAWRR